MHLTINNVVLLTFLKVYVNFKKLTESWVANESRICCFDNGNITITQALFESNADPLPAVREIFVSFSPVQMFEGNIHVFLIPPNYID